MDGYQIVKLYFFPIEKQSRQHAKVTHVCYSFSYAHIRKKNLRVQLSLYEAIVPAATSSQHP